MVEVQDRALSKIIRFGKLAVAHGSTATAPPSASTPTVSFHLDPPENGGGSIDLELKDMGLVFSWLSSRLKEVLQDARIAPSNPFPCSSEQVKLITTLVIYHSIPKAEIWLASGVYAFIHLYAFIRLQTPFHAQIFREARALVHCIIVHLCWDDSSCSVRRHSH